MKRLMVLFLVGAAVTVPGKEAPDWRLELLAEQGVAPDTAALRKMRAQFSVSEEGFAKAVEELGADEFAVREAAERDLLLMGNKILPLLRGLPRSEDPEVRSRLEEIRRALGAKGRWSRDDLLRHAVESLLRERDGAGKPADLVFAEFFRQEKPSLQGGYGRFEFKADAGMGGLVADGVLRMRGKRDGDGDQRLVVTARELTGKEEFPDEFRVEVKLGGEEGGQGAYHVGISIGQVRALFHPGHPGGGFRFEEIGNNVHLSTNASMGFDPAMGKLQRMSVGVRRLAGGMVELDVQVTSADGTAGFGDRKTIPAKTIGKLDGIGLDRSGRTGGDAVFDDLVVDLGGR